MLESWKIQSPDVDLPQCEDFEDVCFTGAHAVCLKQIESRHWCPKLPNQPQHVNGKEARHDAAIGTWCWVSVFSAKRWQSKWQKVNFAGALVSLNCKSGAGLCQSLGPVGAGVVWSYYTVAGPDPVVSQTGAGCPVLLGCTRARHHKELSSVHLQRSIMNHTGPGVASLLT